MNKLSKRKKSIFFGSLLITCFLLLISIPVFADLVGDFNDDSVVDYNDFLILKDAYGSEAGDVNWNSICDIALPYNKIDFEDYMVFILNYGSVATATVSGHTYYAGTTIPLAGVLVSIGSVTDTTGGDGEYNLHNVPSGWQTITATKASYDPYSESIDIPQEGLTKNIEMTAQSPCTLSGTVYDGQQPPQHLPGATISVLNPDGSSSNLVDTTDFTGHYQISNIPQQSIQVQFSKPIYDTKAVTIAMANYDKIYNEQLLMSAIDPPENLNATVNWVQISLSWTGRSESTIKGYNLYRSTQPDSGYTKINTALMPAGTNSYDDTLPDNNDYYYKIASVNDEDGEGSLSNYHFVDPQTSGHITSDTIWSGTIYVTGDVTVDNGVKLTVLPGTIVKFNSGLIVNGTLDAQGTETNMITFTSNSATPSPGDWSGIRFNDSSIDASCIIKYSRIEYAGHSGIRCDSSSPTITNNEIYNNAASWGGGIYCYSYSSPTITNNEIHNNTGIYGGGIYCRSYSSPTITNNEIHNNTASSYFGGGIYCDYSSPTITNNAIYGNASSASGGGIYCYYSSPTITNNTIYGNASPYSGGGIYAGDSAYPTITNNTIYGNAASWGGGIYTSVPSVAITNCIIWGNSGYNLANCSANYSYIGGGAPMFVDPDNGDFHLQPGSPCIDSGTSDGAPTVDKDGNPRYDDPATTPNTGGGTYPYYDMGAYEYQGP